MKFTKEDIQKIIYIIRTPMTAIACRTQDGAESLLSMLGNQGIYWSSGIRASRDNTNWEQHEERTEYNLVDGYLKFGSIAWAEDNAYTIIYFEDIFAPRVSLLDILST